jgi:hypothetical protein
MQTTKRGEIVDQITYAINVQLLVESKTVGNPEAFFKPNQTQISRITAERQMDGFEAEMMANKLTELVKGASWLYGFGQALAGAFAYSLLLIVVALIVKHFGIDLLHALTISDDGK